MWIICIQKNHISKIFQQVSKWLTELIEVYLVKLQFMVVIKIAHFVLISFYFYLFFILYLAIFSYIFFHFFISFWWWIYHIYICIYIYIYIYIYIFLNIKTIICHKYFGCFQNLLQCVWTKHLTKSLQTQQKLKTN